MAWSVGRTRLYVKKALSKFRLVEPGEKVVVGLSGGADSLCLLHVLKDRNERRRLGWELFPVHVNPGFPGWDPGRVVRACGRLGFDCRVVALDVPGRLAKPPGPAPGSSAAPGGLNPCFVCSRARRRALFETAAEIGAHKVALGHHIEDVNETYLLNLLMASSSAAILPRQELFKGEITLIRPLYYLLKPMVRDYLRHYRLRPARNRCPHERAGARLMLRRFLDRLYRNEPRVRTNIFWGIHNLKPQYLPRPVATRRPDAAGGRRNGRAQLGPGS